MPKRILLIDDHKLMTGSYADLLSESALITEIVQANSIEKAYNYIFESKSDNKFDLISIDINMPPFIEKNINNGAELALLIRNKIPDTKIVVITGYCDNSNFKNIYLNINPEGFIEKFDLDPEHFETTFEKVLNGEKYQSSLIVERIQELITTHNLIDDINIEIILLLSKGIKTKDMEPLLPLSLSAIKKRKLKIKQLLNIEDGNNEDIIREATKRKII